ncbi:MAG: type IV toxin-antitoxin system AbiEi family antitoxin domain-containing protein [Thermoleophilaceae bacterium]
MRGESRSRWIDRAIAALAERQHGVLSRLQLLGLGLGTGAIDRRIDSGRLHVIHRGVYAVGHRRLTNEGRWMAAVLAGGRDSVLSYDAGAAVWRIRPVGRLMHVTSPREHERPGMRFHRDRLDPEDVTTKDGIPVTTPRRTLLDLAATLRPHDLEKAVREAQYLRLLTLPSFGDWLSSKGSRPGKPVLVRLVHRMTETPGITRKELELRFTQFIRRHDLPRPDLNALVEAAAHRYEVDCLWRDQRVVVELDGYGSHGTRPSFESDRARDRRLQAAGWRVIRITWLQLEHDAQAIARDLRALLAAS